MALERGGGAGDVHLAPQARVVSGRRRVIQAIAWSGGCGQFTFTSQSLASAGAKGSQGLSM